MTECFTTELLLKDYHIHQTAKAVPPGTYPHGYGNQMQLCHETNGSTYYLANLSGEDFHYARYNGILDGVLTVIAKKVSAKSNDHVCLVIDERLSPRALTTNGWYKVSDSDAVALVREYYSVPDDKCVCSIGQQEAKPMVASNVQSFTEDGHTVYRGRCKGCQKSMEYEEREFPRFRCASVGICYPREPFQLTATVMLGERYVTIGVHGDDGKYAYIHFDNLEGTRHQLVDFARAKLKEYIRKPYPELLKIIRDYQKLDPRPKLRMSGVSGGWRASIDLYQPFLDIEQ